MPTEPHEGISYPVGDLCRRFTKLTLPSAYTAYAGWAVTVGIAVKFGNAHGRSKPDVGSMKCIGACGGKGQCRTIEK